MTEPPGWLAAGLEPGRTTSSARPGTRGMPSVAAYLAAFRGPGIPSQPRVIGRWRSCLPTGVVDAPACVARTAPGLGPGAPQAVW